MFSNNKFFFLGLAIAVVLSTLYVFNIIADPVLILGMLASSFILPVDHIRPSARKS